MDDEPPKKPAPLGIMFENPGQIVLIKSTNDIVSGNDSNLLIITFVSSGMLKKSDLDELGFNVVPAALAIAWRNSPKVILLGKPERVSRSAGMLTGEADTEPVIELNPLSPSFAATLAKFRALEIAGDAASKNCAGDTVPLSDRKLLITDIKQIGVSATLDRAGLGVNV